uniref:Uncharacterized protein n=1 Tax=Arundo donax TaxID=35708 RepID=A0A0A8Y2V4_ARUDO
MSYAASRALGQSISATGRGQVSLMELPRVGEHLRLLAPLPRSCPWRKGAPAVADSLLCVEFLEKAPRVHGEPRLGPDYGGLA